MATKQFPKVGFGSGRKKQMGGGWRVQPTTTREERLAARAERMTASAQATRHLNRPAALLALDAAPVAACPKQEAADCEAYRRIVASLPCAWCGIAGASQHAHENQGKGWALKVDDRRALPLCCDQPGRAGCHPAFDQYRLLPGGRAAHRAWGAQMAAATRALILKSGLWPKHLPKWAEDTTTGSLN